MTRTQNAKKTKKAEKAKEPDERHRPAQPPVLRFSPRAWGKLLYFRDHGETEIGGFGLTAADDLLYVEDFATVHQDVIPARRDQRGLRRRSGRGPL